MYEWFPRSHLILTAVVLVALWFHLPSKKLVARSFFLAGVILWTVVTVLHWVSFTFRNIASGRILAKARVVGLPGAMKVAVNVARPWHVKAGQYIFLSIPAAELTSVLQSHPFLIVWWERNMDGLTIFLLVDPT
jgi:predicted ferric reductase